MQSHLKVPPLGRKAFEKVMSGERKLSALFWAWAKIEHEEHFGYVLLLLLLLNFLLRRGENSGRCIWKSERKRATTRGKVDAAASAFAISSSCRLFKRGKLSLGHARHLGRMDKNWEDGSDTSAVYVNRGRERRV